MLKSYLFRYQGHVGAALVLGGVDKEGAHLYTVYPHGSSDALPFAAMGSGSLAAIATLETGYSEVLKLDDAKELVTRAILAGVLNDLGSGSSVDLCIISRSGTEYVRNYRSDMHRTFKLTPGYEFGDECNEVNSANLDTATRILRN